MLSGEDTYCHTEGVRIFRSNLTWEKGKTMGISRHLLREKHLRNDCVCGDNVFYFFGPRVHETEPATPQRNKRAIFYFKLVAVSCNFFSCLQNWRQAESKWFVSNRHHNNINRALVRENPVNSSPHPSRKMLFLPHPPHPSWTSNIPYKSMQV